jgi:hypothetical protein
MRFQKLQSNQEAPVAEYSYTVLFEPAEESARVSAA